MSELNEIKEKIFEINYKTDILYPLCDILFNNLTQRINDKEDESLYIRNYDRNEALINVIIDHIHEIKELSKLA